MEPTYQRRIALVLICFVTACLLLWAGRPIAQASTCGYPNGPKTGTMVVDVNEYKSCSSLPGLTPSGEFGAQLSNMPAGSILANGNYGGYCVDLTGSLLDHWSGPIVYTVDFWSSLDPNLPSAVKQVSQGAQTYTIPWDKINYLLNTYPNESWLNLQGAYWDLVHGCTQLPGSLYTCDALRPAPYYFPYGSPYSNVAYGCPGSNPPLVDETRVQFLVNDANANGNGYKPKGGDKIASVGQITNCTPTATCNQYLPYQVIFIPTTCPTCTGSIGDRVWKDLNGNGIQDAGEPGIPNVELTLTGTAANGQPVNVTTKTDANGDYLFKELCASKEGTKYTVTVNETTLPPDVIRTAPRSNDGDDNNPSDSNEPTGTTVTITTDTSSNLTVDFGYVPLCTGSIGNLVWKDIPNGNGVYDSGEPGLSGVNLSLSGTNVYGVPVNLTATTSGTGEYTFQGLCQGHYTVKVDAGIPAGFAPTTSTSSSGNDLIDNDSNNPDGTTVDLLTDKDVNQTVDFGYVPKCQGTIGDFVWKDLNENGTQDSGEPGIEFVKVSLSGTNAYGQLVSMTEITDANGKYLFHGVCAGKYTVTVNPSSVPSGWMVTIPPRSTNGSDGNGNDSNEPNGTIVTMTDDTTNNLDVDFGYIPDCKGSIGDFVWDDNNADGIQNDGETSGIAGVQVLLTGTNGYGQPVNFTATTNNSGYYLFSELCKGNYTVAINAATTVGLSPTLPRSNNGNDGNGADSNEPIGTAVTLNSDTSPNQTVDFGYIIPASLGDRVWLDANNNGIQDGGETGITGWTVTITGPNYSNSATTGADGIYGFSNLAPGSYKVCVTPMTGYTQTYDLVPPLDNCATVLLSSGDNRTDVDFGYYKPATIGDKVWFDSNGDGIQNNGEPGLPGVTVTLYDCLTKTAVATTTTDVNGLYSFTGPAGSYYAIFSAPGYYFTKQYQGTDQGLDSNADINGKTDCITIAPGETNNTIDAGLYKNATIGDFVWNDLNGNGIQDAGEPGISGVTVKLFDCATRTLLATTITDANGKYSFTGAPGSFYVLFTAPVGYTFTTKGLVPGATDDSNADSTGKTDCITVASGETNNTIDAGLFQNATIGDFVWEDKNNNGKQDAGEPGLFGVTIKLYDCATRILLATTTTDANGKYSFSVAPGSYYVVFTALAGYTFTTKGLVPGATDDSNADSTGKTDCITVASGESNNTIDAGAYKPCTGTIGDFVWNDLNQNGKQDAGEAGIVNIPVTITGTDFYGKLVNITVNTSASGLYQFSGLCKGTYTVTVATPSGFTPSPTGQGTLTTDSNGSPAPVPLATDNASDQTIDFGFYIPTNACINVTKTCGTAPSGYPSSVSISCPTPGTGTINFYGTVTNCGTVTLNNVTVVDNVGGVNTTIVTGKFLAPGASLTYSGSYKTSSTSSTDTVIATGTDAITNKPVSKSASATCSITPPTACVTIKKKTNGFDANDPNGSDVPRIIPGGAITWTYEVFNCGATSVPKASVVVTDDQGVKPVYSSGDTNGNGSLDPVETWTYAATGLGVNLSATTCSVKRTSNVCTNGGTETARYGYVNVGTVTIPGATSSDKSSYCNPLSPPPGTLTHGDTATIGYWQNKNGQALIKSLNGGATSKKLANWLASNFPYLYGANAGANNLTGKTNADVAALFIKFFNVTGAKVDAQIMGGALAVYVSNSSLAGNVAAGYGFNVSSTGTAAKTFAVGGYGTAIGLTNNQSYTVLKLLQQANLQKKNGTFNANAFNVIFDGINAAGDII